MKIGQFGAILAFQFMHSRYTSSSSVSADNILADFGSGKRIGEWKVINDNVMGGVSTSSAVAKKDHFSFSGTVRLENNGGFASCRFTSSSAGWNLSEYEGLKIVLHPSQEKKEYQLYIKDTQSLDEQTNFQAQFSSDGSSIVYIPFKDLVPLFRGRRIQRGPLVLDKIATVGFMAKRPLIVGDFELKIVSISAYRR
jgi:monofunctional biosynthetic peptidoglycan transglycosylase